MKPKYLLVFLGFYFFGFILLILGMYFFLSNFDEMLLHFYDYVLFNEDDFPDLILSIINNYSVSNTLPLLFIPFYILFIPIITIWFLSGHKSDKRTESRFATMVDLKENNLIYKGGGKIFGIYDCAEVVKVFLLLGRKKLLNQEKLECKSLGKSQKSLNRKLIKIDKRINNYRKRVSKKVKHSTVKTFEPLSEVLFSPPGTGKTAGVVIPTVFHFKGSMIIFDPKGEVFDTTKKFREKLGTVKRLNFTRKESHKYNPLDASSLVIGTAEQIDAKGGELSNKFMSIDNIAGILINVNEQGADPYFTGAALNMLRAIIKVCVVLNSNDNLSGGGTSFNEVGFRRRADFSSEFEKHKFGIDEMDAEIVKLQNKLDRIPPELVEERTPVENEIVSLTNEKNDNFVSKYSLEEANLNAFFYYLLFKLDKKINTLNAKIDNSQKLILNDLRTQISGFSTMASDELSGVAGSMQKELTIFSNPVIRENTNDNDIDFEEFFSGDKNGNPVTVYITSPLEDIKTIAPVVNLLFENATKSFLSRENPAPTDHQVCLVIDEFPQLGRMDAVIEAPAVSRGKNFSTIYIAQDPAQINKIYNKSGSDASQELCNTCSFTITFAQNDFHSAKKISDLAGVKKYKEVSNSYDRNGVKTSSSVSWNEKPLVSPTDVQTLKLGEMLVMAQFLGDKPMKLNLYPWFLDQAILDEFS